MYTAADLRKGLRVEVDGVPYIITEFNFTKPGKGQSIYNCRLKNMLTGSTFPKSYRSNDTIDKPNLEEKRVRYSYAEGDRFIFLDEGYEQVVVGADVLRNNRFFLDEDMPVDVLFHNGEPVDVSLPNFVEKEVVHTEPGARGNTATNVLKPAQIAGGYEIHVPLFVNQGDIVRIDTRTGDYCERVNKR
jgi:elongation factor P